MDQRDVRAELINAWPPGTDYVLDWTDDPGRLVDGLAQTILERAIQPLDALRREISPLTATLPLGLTDYERMLGLDQSDTALTGTREQRRDQVIARYREIGPPTTDAVRAVVAPFLRYASPTDIVILETPRTALRTAHTRSWTGALDFGGFHGPKTITWLVLDDPRCGDSGAQIDLTFAAPVGLGPFSALLVGPGGDVVLDRAAWSGPGRDSSATLRLWARSFAKRPIWGTWSLTIDHASPSQLTSAGLFVEALGRNPTGEGLGAAIFHWGVVAEEDKLGAGANLRGAQQSIWRITYARAWANLLRRSKGMGALPPGQLAAIPDNPNAIPDQGIPG